MKMQSQTHRVPGMRAKLAVDHTLRSMRSLATCVRAWRGVARPLTRQLDGWLLQPLRMERMTTIKLKDVRTTSSRFYMVVADDHRLFVADDSDRSIQTYTTDGVATLKFIAGCVPDAIGLATVPSKGLVVLVLDTFMRCVMVHDANSGLLLFSWKVGAFPVQAVHPRRAMAVWKTQVYLVAANHLRVLDVMTGDLLTEWSLNRTCTPLARISFTVATQGHLLVLNHEHGNVDVYSATGVRLLQWHATRFVASSNINLCVRGQYVLMCEHSENTVTMYTLEGTRVKRFTRVQATSLTTARHSQFVFMFVIDGGCAAIHILK